MEHDVIATHLENLDRRLATVEQILPTLATKDDLKVLATKEELREEGERSRRHMNVLHEDLRSDIRLLAEHVASDRPKHGKG